MKKLILTTTLCFCALQAVANDKQPIKFATEATYPPFVSMQSNGKMVGFSVDLVHALCKQMHKKCELINAPWASLIPALQMGQYNALFGGMAITKQREQVVNFSSPYYKNAVVYVSKKGGAFNAYHLKGMTIGVQGGSQFQNYLQKTYGSKITIKSYLSNMTALMDLQSGRLDAVFIDQPVAKLWLDKNHNSKKFHIAGKVQNKHYFGAGNGIALNKSNPVLLKNINAALKTIEANGSYNKIVSKWFGDK
jgi:arginine transport system substrate-binding protein